MSPKIPSTSKTDGTHTATYAYRYGNKLYSVTSDFPSEGNVTYGYNDVGQRISRTAGGTTKNYRWLGWRVVNEEDASGNLTRAYVGRNAAHVDGSDPSTGTWRYYAHDHLGSSRGIYNADKTLYAAVEYTPYGEIYATSGTINEISRRYTGHDWDETAEMFYAPYRFYSPKSARWLTRDPLGMIDGPNVYTYVRGNPVKYSDPSGGQAQVISDLPGWLTQVEGLRTRDLDVCKLKRCLNKEKGNCTTACLCFAVQGLLDAKYGTETCIDVCTLNDYAESNIPGWRKELQDRAEAENADAVPHAENQLKRMLNLPEACGAPPEDSGHTWLEWVLLLSAIWLVICFRRRGARRGNGR